MSWARRLFPVAFCAAAALAVAVGCSGPSAPTSAPADPVETHAGASEGASVGATSVPATKAHSRRATPDEAERARARLDAAGAELVSSEAAWRSIRESPDVPRADIDEALDRVREARAALDGAGQDMDWRARRGRVASPGTAPLGETTAAR
jgi:hypothetical protein